MIKSNADLYRNIHELTKTLRASNQSFYASKLEEALSISTIAGEILGEIRLVLLELNNSRVSSQLHIKEKTIEALAYINKII